MNALKTQYTFRIKAVHTINLWLPGVDLVLKPIPFMI